MLPHIDYDLDVDGDVILTLENPNAPFAVWSEGEGLQERPRPLQPILDDEVVSNFRQIDPAWKGNPPVFQSSLSGQHTWPVPSLLEEMMSEQTGLEDDKVVNKKISQVRFRLSSRHLISASPYFRALLTGPWEESTARDGSLYNISTTDWDENAFKLLIDIVHGNSQNVPRSVDLELLAKIAVLVDYYKCYDVVKFYSDTWIEHLGGSMKANYHSREFFLVLFVSCVFFQSATLRNLTYQAIQETQAPLRSLGLPFPERLIEEIDRIRKDTVGNLLDRFHDLLQYLATRNDCKGECNAVLVGSLYREMSAWGILSPRPAPPFHGFSIAGVVKMARNPIRMNGRKGNHNHSNCTCNVGTFLSALATQMMDSVHCLELKDYVTNPWVDTAPPGCRVQ